MKVSASLSGEKLILDYLHRVTEAANRSLPKGSRMAFVGRTRARIHAEVGTGDRKRVSAVLAALGEPEDLVRAERAKIEAAWAEQRDARAKAIAAAEAAKTKAERAAPALTAPVRDRQRSSRRVPAATTPFPYRVPRPADPPPGESRAPAVVEPAARTLRSGSAVPAVAAWGASVVEESGWLARRHKLEATAIVLIAAGVVFPVLPPVWLVGAGLALASRLWDVRDKWAALFGAVAVTLAGGLVIAGAARGTGNIAVIYLHALAAGAGYLIRAGCLLTAVYLGWRVHRGPRPRVPPWKRA